MKRQWKAFLAILCCLVLVATLITACATNTVTVTFDPNYDGAKPIKNSVEKGTVVLPPTLTRERYELEGWYKDVECTLRISDTGYKVSSDITFYAKWTPVKNDDGGGDSSDPQEKDYDVNVIANEQLSIHFLELGNNYIGDSIYIKAGDTDILIDAGSREDSATRISSYINRFCDDGKLEYVVVTHAHQDHIAGFVGNNNNGIFDLYECENIIEFAKYNTSSKISQSYFAKRDAQKAAGANVYTALECVDNSNGAQKVYNLTDDGSITMEILDQKYYHQKDSSKENNHSVCVLISQGDNHYLFTGDLEKAGEESLVAYNPNLPEVQLYKGGHHGSSTSSNEVLMEKVKPKTVCVCSCAGSVEYSQDISAGTFPTQAFINRVAPYTDRVYITSLIHTVQNGVDKDGNPAYVNTTRESMNGDIVFACTNNQITMYFSNNNTKLKDTDWFKEYRQCPSAWA